RHVLDRQVDTLTHLFLVGELSLETCPVRRRIALTPLVLLAADRGKSLGGQAVLRMALIAPLVHAAAQLFDGGRSAPQTLPRAVALALARRVFGGHGVDGRMDVILPARATLARSLGSLGVGLTGHEHLLAGIHLGQALLDESERLGRLLGIVRVHLMRSEAVLHGVTLMAELVLAIRRDTGMRRRL